MRLRARLTSPALEQYSNPPNDPRTDFDFRALAKLFAADPKVGIDDQGWYLSSSALDEADDGNKSGAVRDELSNLMATINGVALLLRPGASGRAVEATGTVDGLLNERNVVEVAEISVEVFSDDGLSPEPAGKLYRLAREDDDVRRVLQLLAHVDPEWIWFDLYRIWDVMKVRSNGSQFRDWVDGLWSTANADRISFENSANDPRLGPNRRHALGEFETRHAEVYGVRAIGPAEALVLTKRVVQAWIERERDLKLTRQ